MNVHPAIAAALGGFAPTEEQRAAIESPAEPLSIIAGAGSGKTAVMAARIAQLVVTGTARPSEVLGLTFTNKAAGELDERIRRSLALVDLPPGEEATVYTYHAFADRLLRDFGPKIGIEPEVALLSEAQVQLLIARLFEDVTFDRLRVTYLPGLISKVRGLSEACANHLVEPEAVVEADAALARRYETEDKKLPDKLAKALTERPELCRVVRAYMDRKRALGRIDYGDQIRFAYELVTRRAEVADALRKRWPVVLLDEYQDTNVAQRKMMEAIYPPGSAITVVGDPDQAIYAWRGATLYNILKFGRHFTRSDGTTAPRRSLERSFRSGRRILAAADAVISAVPIDRRGGEKVLKPHPPRGDGEVLCDLFESEADEAASIAADIKAIGGMDGAGLLGETVPFDEVAVLCRKKRLFAKIHEALRAEGVPVEVVGLGGLLTVPEVIDLLAYLRLVENPGDNIAFARIAMGPRWRIHFHDVAALARWAAANTHSFKVALEERAGDPNVDPGEERFSLMEALERLSEISELSDEAADRLARLHRNIESMRAMVRGATLTEAIESILDASGIQDELLAAGTPVAHAALANIGSFLDRAGEFSPVEGEVSVTAFLEFLNAARESEELEAAQPQIDNAVKLMTVHQAKGLEFDLIFVPGMAKGIFPDNRVNDNPTTAVGELPYSVREDREELPEFDVGVSLKSFNDALKDRAMEDERRLAYVAFTRARKSLRLSAAHWYGAERERKTSSGPGLFFTELAGADESADAPATPAHAAVTVRSRALCPEENPLKGELAARAERWPPDTSGTADGLFPGGPRRAAERVLAEGSALDDLVAASGVATTAFESARREIAEQLRLVTAPPPEARPDERLASLSVSSLVQLARCPKQFYWTVVRPLPRRPSAKARLGHDVHRKIEILSIGQQRIDDPEEPFDLAPEERAEEAAGWAPGGQSSDDLLRAFTSSRFAQMQPRHIEQPFVLSLNGEYLVRGRIDAVFTHDDGTWELVDYKTGREPEPDDATAQLQLAIYALAARRIWNVDPTRLRVTYLYLATGRAETVEASDLTTDEGELVQMFDSVRRGEFAPTPGPLCHYCDFRRFCPAGRRYVEAEGGG